MKTVGCVLVCAWLNGMTGSCWARQERSAHRQDCEGAGGRDAVRQVRRHRRAAMEHAQVARMPHAQELVVLADDVLRSRRRISHADQSLVLRLQHAELCEL